MKEKKRAIKELKKSETFILSTVRWKDGIATITTIIDGSLHGIDYAKKGIDLKYKKL